MRRSFLRRGGGNGRGRGLYNASAARHHPSDCREELLGSGRLGNDLIPIGVLGIRGEIVPAQEDRLYPGVPVLHLVAQREAIHRLDKNLRDQQVHLLAIGHLQTFPPRQRRLNLVPGRLLEDIENSPQILLPVHDENFHTLLMLTCPAGSGAAGRS